MNYEREERRQSGKLPILKWTDDAFVVNEGQGEKVHGRGDQRGHAKHLQHEADARCALPYVDVEHHRQKGVDDQADAIQRRGEGVGHRQI